MSHVREARMLCKKVVNFFMLLSHTHETGARKMSITQELLSLVTGLAHYLKILIRIALTGSLKLEREHANAKAIGLFLGRLDRLARDPEANKISSTVAALVKKNAGAGASSTSLHAPSRKDSAQSASSASSEGANVAAGPDGSVEASSSSPSSTSAPPARPTYGYKSLARAVGTLIGQGEATTDLCEGCRLTVEEECARLGTSVRWHLACLRCPHCQRTAARDASHARDEVHVAEFVWVEGAAAGDGDEGALGAAFCRECAARERGGLLEGTGGGAGQFAYVTRLEQYAFLLCVALNKLFGRLKQRGVVGALADEASDEARSLSDAYRDSTDIKRMKSVQLDRKLSATQARTPMRSTIVQSPSGRTATSDATDTSFTLFQTKPPVPSRKDQPLVDTVRGTTIPRNQVREVVPPSSGAATSSSAKSTTPTNLSIVTTPTAPAHADRDRDRTASPTVAAGPRPGLQRTTTAVRIVDDPVGAGVREPEGLGGASEPTQDEEGLTLADLPKALEAEQRRSDPSRPSPPPITFGSVGVGVGAGSNGAYPGSSTAALSLGPKLLSELSALEYFIVKHVAAVLLSSESSALRDAAPLDELLEIIDARGKTFWGKLFKGGQKEKSVKKKGAWRRRRFLPTICLRVEIDPLLSRLLQACLGSRSRSSSSAMAQTRCTVLGRGRSGSPASSTT